MNLAFLVPGDLGAPTGGYAYARRVIDGLRACGDQVEVLSLAGDYPNPDAAARAEARRAMAGLPDGQATLIDGLALGVLPQEAGAHARRLDLIALVHHPLCLETGLDAARQRELFESERAALAQCRRIVTTSEATARGLVTLFGIEAARIRVVPPGTERRPPALGSGAAPLQLLCVGAVVPRKGHLALIDALSGLAHRAWRLRCVGSLDRDPAFAALARERSRASGLDDRIEWLGALDDAALARVWSGSDLFVLASEHEGYGMAFAEALSAGLPIIGTTAAAVPELRTAGARLVEPGDVAALRAAIAELLADGDRRAAMAGAAREAGQRLPQWSDTARLLRAAIVDPASASTSSSSSSSTSASAS